MRFCWGAQLSQTLGKTNFSFSQSTPVLSSKQRQSWKFKKVSILKQTFMKTPSPPTIKNVAESFLYFPWDSGGFLCKRGKQPWRKVTATGNSINLQPHTLWAKVFLDWSGKSWRFCSLVPWKEELPLLQLTASTWHSLWYLQQRWSCSKKECFSFHPQEKQKHKPSSSCYCFLVLELSWRAAIVLRLS